MKILELKFSFTLIEAEKSKKFLSSGYLGGFLIGFLFALSFCPVSAALFFGSLIPLALNNHFYSIFISLIYGLGTGLPVIVVSLFVIFSFKYFLKMLNLLKITEKIGSFLTGTIFIIIGLYYSLKYIF